MPGIRKDEHRSAPHNDPESAPKRKPRDVDQDWYALAARAFKMKPGDRFVYRCESFRCGDVPILSVALAVAKHTRDANGRKALRIGWERLVDNTGLARRRFDCVLGVWTVWFHFIRGFLEDRTDWLAEDLERRIALATEIVPSDVFRDATAFLRAAHARGWRRAAT